MASDMDEPKIGRNTSRRMKQRRTYSNNSSKTSKSCVTTVGLILSFCVIFVYMIGFYETIQSIPAVQFSLQKKHATRFLRRLGRNFNPARPETDWDETENSNDDEFKRDNQISHDHEINLVNAVNEEEIHERNDSKQYAAERNSKTDFRSKQQEVITSGIIAIPPAKWPVSIRNEDESTWETLIHPGDGETEMKVPSFWSRPVHNGTLMSRQMAEKIGSCIEPDSEGNYNRGSACPSHQRTIFVGIASYRDFECRSTVESIFLRAAHPERIRVGVVDQIVHGEDPVCNAPIESCEEKPEQALCIYSSQVNVYEMAASLSIGPVYARHIGYRLYRGEYYATQSDAHVTYTKDWDDDIISQLEATTNEMAVLTTYLTDVQGAIDERGYSLLDTRPIMCNTIYEGGPQGMHLRHASQPERKPSIHGMPQLSPWWAAGYSFSRGHFVVNVPYDWLQPMVFQGEEMSIGIRGFTIGYDYYAPERSVCFHHYAVGKNAGIRNKVHHFWENDNKYAGTGRGAMKRLLGIVHMNPEDPLDSWDHTEESIYGIGGVRTPEKFYEIFGIDVRHKTIEQHLCQFVDIDGKMHNMFQPHLRENGMGIDYTYIDYKFKDPFTDH